MPVVMTGRLDLKSLETADRKIVIKPFNRLSSKLIVTDCIKREINHRN